MTASTEELEHRASAGFHRRGALSGVALRLFGLLAVVIVVAVGSLWLVDTILEARIFSADRAGEGPPGELDPRSLEAFSSANATAGVVALLVALLVALVLSLLIARAVDRLSRGVVTAAASIATGDFAARVPDPSLGSDARALVEAFNLMAGHLEQVETTRRQLLGDLAHELRTPIATMDAYLEAVEDGVAALDAETLAVMEAQVRRLSRLADDVANVSAADQQPSVDKSLLSMGQLVVATVRAASRTAEMQGVELHHEVAPRLPLILADRERLEQVLTNLIGNAVRHTPAGGMVNVRVHKEGQQVQVDVRDTGEGIRAEDLPLVTTRFYRGPAGPRGRSEGSGVGLWIARAIVRAHRGGLDVRSDGPGQGATVSFWVPIESAGHVRPGSAR